MRAQSDRGIGDLLVEVNERIRELAAEHPAAADHWDFLCECGRRGCFEPVSLTLAEYAALRVAGVSILAPRHRQTAGEAA
jgi:hypothetical protein